jgi:hypothetical protein
LLLANAGTTGHPLSFGYTVMWGSAHDPGFHVTPWGEVHTPLQGLELISLYFLRLQQYFLEAPVPGLLPAAIALIAARSLTAFDRYLVVAGGLLVGLYFAYWHDGYFLGPRFMYPLVPFLALWTARLLPALRSAVGDGMGFRVASCALLGAVPFAMHQAASVRATQYSSGLQTMRFDADAAARAQGIRDAVILVRESWGAEVMVRLWAVGISRGEAELLYRHIDTCQLDLALLDVEERGLEGPEAREAFLPLLADSSRVLASTLSPDFTQRMLPGLVYPPRCLARLQDDAQGTTLFAPFILAGESGNLFIRDLHERNGRILAGLAGRLWYLMRPEGTVAGSPIRLVPVVTDSIHPRGREVR